MSLSPVSERTAKMTNALSPAVFVDRDGTIMEDCDYCSDPKDVRIFPGAREAQLRSTSNAVATLECAQSAFKPVCNTTRRAVLLIGSLRTCPPQRRLS